MAGKTTSYDTSVLKILLNATAISNVCDNAATSPLTNLYVSLHTSDPGPGAASGQNTNEVSTSAYTGYARVAVARTTGGWTVSSGSCSPVAAITFPACTGGTGATITHFGIGSLSSGTGVLYYSGTVTPNISVSNGVTPSLTTASTITEA